MRLQLFLIFSLFTVIIATCEQDDSDFQTLLAVQIRDDGLEFAENVLAELLKKLFERYRNLPNLKVPYYGMRIKLTNMTFAEIGTPLVSIKLLPPGRLRLIVKLTDLVVNGRWRLKRFRGIIKAWPKINGDTVALVELEPRISKEGFLEGSVVSCNIDLRPDTSVAGSFQRLLNTTLVRKRIANSIRENAREPLCRLIKRSIDQAFDRIPKLVSLTRHYILNYKMRQFSIGTDEITAAVEANVDLMMEDYESDTGSEFSSDSIAVSQLN